MMCKKIILAIDILEKSKLESVRIGYAFESSMILKAVDSIKACLSFTFSNPVCSVDD